MAVYKNKKRNTWYTSFYYTDWDGKRKRKKKEGLTSKREALEYEHNFLERTSKKGMIPFDLLVNIYLNNCKKRIKPSTYITKNTIIQKYILSYFQNLKINEIKNSDIFQWQIWILEQNRTKTSQYLYYINVQLSCIFNFAKKYYGLNNNPVKQCDIIKNIKSQPKLFWTLDEYNSFIKELNKKDPLYVIFNLLFWTGIRRGELLALRPVDFDFKNEKLIIQRNLVYIKSKPQINTPKTINSWRIISISKFLLRIVKEYILENNIKKEDYLFKITPNKILQGIKLYSKKAGVASIRIHDFRHAHASLLIEQGFSPIIVAKRLGHKDINTTLKIYAHLYPYRQKILADKLEELYQNLN